MRKIIAGILTAVLLLSAAGCASGAETQGSQSESTAQTAAVAEAGQAAAAQDSSTPETAADASAAETSGATIELTLPAQYGDAGMTQAECDATAEANGYESVTLNEDGSVTYAMTEARHQQLLKDTAESIDASLESMCTGDEYPDLVSISPNEDYSEFVVWTKNEAMTTEESMSVMSFDLYGGMYQTIAGNPGADIHVIFRNSITDAVIGELHSSDVVSDTVGGFTDVAADSYYGPAVTWAVQSGIAHGTDETHFSPDAACTRAQLITFLWRLAGEPATEMELNPYTDVADTDGAYTAVLWATEYGIAAGTTETEFSPDENVTRAEAVLCLWRYAGSPAPENAESSFEDVESGTDLCSAVMWAVEQGITAGTSETTFEPDAPCTRGQIVTFLYRGFGS